MRKRNIIVIGASAGGYEVIKKIVESLPPDLEASIFIVWHMSADISGLLPRVLNQSNTVFAVNAIDNEPILPNRIYVAPPDRHLLIQKNFVRVTKGPKENRFRPAIDPLFRSAAYTYGAAVIGVVLSGALNDGTAGLWAIKNRGGVTIVQDPADAEVPSMPANALREVEIDYVVPASGIASLISKLSLEQLSPGNFENTEPADENDKEIRIMIPENKHEGVMQFGELTPYTCPECHGVLSAIKEGKRIRFRCHTGHGFSAESLLESLSEDIEHTLWSAARGMEESMVLLNHLGDHFAELNQTHFAAMYFQKSLELQERIDLLRRSIIEHEQVNIGVKSNNAKQY